MTLQKPHLAGTRFLVIGRAGMDLVADPPGQTIVGTGQFVAMLGGSSANIAAGLVRLGCQAAMATTVSDDAIGHFVLDALDRHGIDRTHVHLVGGEHRTSLALVESRPVNTQSVIYRNQAADFAFDLAMLDAIDLGAYDAMVLTGTALAAEPSRSTCLAAMARARAAGLVVVLDIDYRPYSWPSDAVASEICLMAAASSDVVIGNDVEFGILAGPSRNGADLAACMGKGTNQATIYKMGPEGSVAFVAGERIETGIFAVAPLKPTGAGDAFMAALLASLATGESWPEAIRNGSAAAALVVTRIGCAPAMPDRAELADFMAGATMTPKAGS